MTEEEYCEEYMRKACIKELAEEAKFEAISEIKEDLIEIKDTMKKMQEYIKRIEDNFPFYPTT